MSSPDVMHTKLSVGTPNSFEQPMIVSHCWEPSQGNKITLPYYPWLKIAKKPLSKPAAGVNSQEWLCLWCKNDSTERVCLNCVHFTQVCSAADLFSGCQVSCTCTVGYFSMSKQNFWDITIIMSEFSAQVVLVWFSNISFNHSPPSTGKQSRGKKDRFHMENNWLKVFKTNSF